MNNKLKYQIFYKEVLRGAEIVEADGFEFSHVSPFVIFWEHPRDKEGKITSPKQKNLTRYIHEDQIFTIVPLF